MSPGTRAHEPWNKFSHSFSICFLLSYVFNSNEIHDDFFPVSLWYLFIAYIYSKEKKYFIVMQALQLHYSTL